MVLNMEEQFDLNLDGGEPKEHKASYYKTLGGEKKIVTQFMKKVKDQDKITEMWLSGFDKEGMPGVEHLPVYKVHITMPKKYTDYQGKERLDAGGRVYYELCGRPVLCPLNGSRELSREPHLGQRGFDPERMLFKNQISSGNRKASFHKSREKAEIRLRQWIDLRFKKVTAEHEFVTRYMIQLKAINQGVDAGDVIREQAVKELTDQPKRRMSL